MTTRRDAAEALESREWSGAEAEPSPAPARFVYSVRVDRALSDWVAAEADRRGVSPSVVIREAIAGAKAAGEVDRTVTMRLSDLHRAIDALPPLGERQAA